MILCISANPALDRRLLLEDLIVGGVNRAYSSKVAPGGKAAHVAMVAHALGEELLWVGFLGGATGEECEHGLKALGIKINVVRVSSATRINLEIIDDKKIITEVLEPGDEVTTEEVNRMFGICDELFVQYQEKAVVVMSGSLPPGAPVDFYARMIRAARAYGCRTFLDTSGQALQAALEASPDFVKSNREEAMIVTRMDVNDRISAVKAGHRMIDLNARSVAVSLGSDGLVWLRGKIDPPLFAPPLKVDVRSTVGCGDATIAGFAVAAVRDLDAEHALRLAAACGAANCMASMPGQVLSSDIHLLASRAQIDECDRL